MYHVVIEIILCDSADTSKYTFIHIRSATLGVEVCIRHQVSMGMQMVRAFRVDCFLLAFQLFLGPFGTAPGNF